MSRLLAKHVPHFGWLQVKTHAFSEYVTRWVELCSTTNQDSRVELWGDMNWWIVIGVLA